MLKLIGSASSRIKTSSITKLSVKNPLSQMGLFPAPTRHISSLSEAMSLVVEYKEAISLATGVLGYGLNLFLARKTVTAKRLILIVRQAGADNMPPDFDSIMKSADINSKDSEGNSALHYACASGNKNIVRALLSMGANPDRKNNRGETAFYQAAFAGHLSVIDIFLDVATQYTTGVILASKISIADIVNQNTKTIWTPLLAATFNNHTKVVTKLITHGARIDVKNQKGETSLFLAAMNNNILLVKFILFNADLSDETVQYLIKHEDCHKNGTPLYIAADRGYAEIVKLLLRRGAKNTPSIKGKQTPLHIALLNGHEIITGMLSNDSEVYSHLTPDGWSVIDYAIHCAQRRQSILDSERTLLDNYFSTRKLTTVDQFKLSRIPFYDQQIPLDLSLTDVPSDDIPAIGLHQTTSLHLLAIANQPQSILNRHDDVNTPNQYGYTAVHDAVFFGSMEAVVALIDRGADIDSPRKDGSTPLATAAFFMQTDIALYLINQGAKIDTENQWGESSLYFAIINNDLKLARKLCEKRVDLRHIDKHGYSYMHTVAKHGTAEMARLLLLYGALRDPKTDNFKNFPTHVAVIAENIGVLDVLLFEHGADPDARNINNLTPQQLAQDNESIKSLLDRARHAKTTVSLDEKTHESECLIKMS